MPDQLTPLARISAAIEKLERLKINDAAIPWTVEDSGSDMGASEIRAHDVGPFGPMDSQVADSMERNTADLIVTLHRTIEVQMVMLKYARDEIDYLGDDFKPSRCDEPHAVAMAIQLASAILGGES